MTEIEQAFDALGAEEQEEVIDHVFGACLVRFPILDCLNSAIQPWVTRNKMLKYAMDTHREYWAIDINDPDEWSIDRLKDELGTCAQAYLRKGQISKALKSAENSPFMKMARRDLRVYIDAMMQTIKSDISITEDWGKPSIWNLLKFIQATRYTDESDFQIWDFLWTIINCEKDVFKKDSWAVKVIIEEMNEDYATPPPKPNTLWTRRDIENTTKRLERCVKALIETTFVAEA